ncbi:MAG: hypothetical protein MI924_23555, partial [Chloroflexales bacterium]|nr:hypothetical protein [Chloroflexales bacterium]
FRFVLELRPGFQTVGELPLALASLSPGTYVVSYDGAFAVRQLTPPAPMAALQPMTLQSLRSQQLVVSLANDGLEDIATAQLELWATAPWGEAALALTRTVELPAETRQNVVLQWAPPASGEWRVTPQLRFAEGQIQTYEPVVLAVQDNIKIDPVTIIEFSTIWSSAPLFFWALLSLSAAAGAVFWLYWR